MVSLRRENFCGNIAGFGRTPAGAAEKKLKQRNWRRSRILRKCTAAGERRGRSQYSMLILRALADYDGATADDLLGRSDQWERRDRSRPVWQPWRFLFPRGAYPAGMHPRFLFRQGRRGNGGIDKASTRLHTSPRHCGSNRLERSPTAPRPRNRPASSTDGAVAAICTAQWAAPSKNISPERSKPSHHAG